MPSVNATPYYTFRTGTYHPNLQSNHSNLLSTHRGEKLPFNLNFPICSPKTLSKSYNHLIWTEDKYQKKAFNRYLIQSLHSIKSLTGLVINRIWSWKTKARAYTRRNDVALLSAVVNPQRPFNTIGPWRIFSVVSPCEQPTSVLSCLLIKGSITPTPLIASHVPNTNKTHSPHEAESRV